MEKDMGQSSWVLICIGCEGIDSVGLGGYSLGPGTSNKGHKCYSHLGTRAPHSWPSYLASISEKWFHSLGPFSSTLSLHPWLPAFFIPTDASVRCAAWRLYVESTHVKWVLARIIWCPGSRIREFSHFRLTVQWKLAEQVQRSPASSFIPKADLLHDLPTYHPLPKRQDTLELPTLKRVQRNIAMSAVWTSQISTMVNP